MKCALIPTLAIALFLGQAGWAQSVSIPTAPGSSPVYTYVEQMPVFPGGQQALLQTIGQTVAYPTEAMQQRLEGRVFVQFVVGATGAVQQTTVVKGVHPLLDSAAVLAVKALSAFSPGKQHGRAVPVAFTLPITFKLPPDVENILATRAGRAVPVALTTTDVRFPGGPQALAAYLSAAPYPKAARASQAEGRVYVRFRVEADGSLDFIKALVPPKPTKPKKSSEPAVAASAPATTTNPILVQAAEQYVAAMPAWQPALRKGIPSASSYTLPIDFYTTPPVATATPVYAYADTAPVFAGTSEEMPLPHVIGRATRYPVEALRSQLQGEVLVHVVIDELGQITEADIVQSAHPILDQEALRVVKAQKVMAPAMLQGKPVRTFITLPLTFSIVGNKQFQQSVYTR
ncbi:TonB family protein [Hymenobacter taeanensis]|uniref:TonB family protein n=1 Tax=Hymenobacter taeanensis TaxID=2735321 RepID=A0A6M6BGU2_9BACT|nr:TonB family protein [Hymenobacter taeanensis]QJX46245.1 TonB family protein [Hymenobacter taeanensis]